jgi:hypothetical protein
LKGCQLARTYYYRVPALALAAAAAGEAGPITSKSRQDAADLQQPPESDTSTETDSQITVSGQQQQIHVGPRGGRYYINSNGRKTYLKQKQAPTQTFPRNPPRSPAAAGAGGAGSRSTTVSTAAQEEAEAGADSTTIAATADAAAAAAAAAAAPQAAAEGGSLADTASSSSSYEEDEDELPYGSVYVDASMTGGGGGPCIGIWIEGAYNSLDYAELSDMYEDVPDPEENINDWEFFAIVVAIRLYAPYMKSRKSEWLIHTDSQAAQAWFESSELYEPNPIDTYLTEVWSCLKKNKTRVTATWIPGNTNDMADALSREQWDRVKAELPEWSAKTPKSRLR